MSLLLRLLRAAPRLALVLGLAALGLPAAVLATFLGRGSVEHLLLATIPSLVLAPVLILAGGVLWIWGFRVESVPSGRRLRWVAAFLVGLAGFFLVLAPSYLPGMVLHHRDVSGAMRYCDDLVPRLEAWKDKRGEYPATIDVVLPAERPTPRLLRGSSFYRRLGSGYELVFLDPAEILGGYSYFFPETTARGRWEHWD